MVRLRGEWLSLLETRVTAAGFGTEPRVTTPQGTAAVGQMLGLLELRAAFRHGHALRPALGVGVGFLRVNVEGTAAAPYEGFHGERWSALFDVGAGLSAKLFRGLSVAVEAHGQLAAPYPTVRFAGQGSGAPRTSGALLLLELGGAAVSGLRSIRLGTGASLLLVCLAGCGPAPIEAIGVSARGLANGLVGHWAFDEVSGAAVSDRSGNSQNGQISGVTWSWETAGRFAGGLRLQPGDSVTIPSFRPATSDWTVSVWIT